MVQEALVFFLAIIEAHQAANREDLQLMLKISERDQAAFAALYDRYSAIVYTLILRIVKTSDNAEDILQEVFLQLWNKATLFSESRGSVYTWLISMARNKAIDHIRSRDRSPQESSIDAAIALPVSEYLADPLHAAISAEHERYMKDGLAQLTSQQREIIELSYYEGYTQTQIAERMAVPLGTVKTWMRQGMLKLRTYLKERLTS
ncbi:MAG TPA: sigma-70 family RNA polymerase sigma factor [Bacteroidota bacterium]|nr:sigma-70 family RNA polymerase sigma factor [Bacteroidota bacterium]